jgi:hypothetical protein
MFESCRARQPSHDPGGSVSRGSEGARRASSFGLEAKWVGDDSLPFPAPTGVGHEEVLEMKVTRVCHFRRSPSVSWAGRHVISRLCVGIKLAYGHD